MLNLASLRVLFKKKELCRYEYSAIDLWIHKGCLKILDLKRMAPKVFRLRGNFNIGKETQASEVYIHLQNLLWVYCPVHAGVKGNGRADRLAGKATLTSGLLLGRSEVLKNLRHYLRAKNQGRHTIDRLEERGVERESTRRMSLKGRESAIVNQMKLFQRRRWGNF